jgi:hypothetical protein
MKYSLRVKVMVVGLFLIWTAVQAQMPVYNWARTTLGNVESIQRGAVVDAAGNVYITGVFFGTVDFDPGPAVCSVTPVPYGCNAYVAKYDALGNFLWVKNIAIAASYGNNSIAMDISGNIYITGFYSGTTDFNPGPGVFSVTSSAGSADMYLVKLDGNGNFIWANTMGSTTDDRGNEVVTDPAGNVYVAGNFTGTVDFDPGPGIISRTSSGGTDMFLLKYDGAGIFQWVKQMGGFNDDDIRDIALDGSGNIFIAGSFNGTADFDPGAGVMNLVSNGNKDMFFAKYDPAGNYGWSRSAGGTGIDLCTALAVAGGGDVFLTGIFNATVDFNAGVGINTLTSGITANSFVLRYDGAGNFNWVKGLPLNTANLDIVIDAYNTFFISGSYGNINGAAIDMDPGAGVAALTIPGGLPPPYYNVLGRYDWNGNYLWAGVFGHTCYCSVAGYKSSMAVKTGYLYYSGIFNGNAFSAATVDFDPGSGIANLTAPSSVDNTFFTKFGISLSPLPVDLVNFFGRQEKSGILLNWNTASESDNDYFEIWRSSEADNFTLIGKVNGNGTTTAPIAYEFIDISPLPGLNYYQLRQVDYNGTPELSNIVVVLNRSNSISCTLVPVITGKYILECAGLSSANYSILDMNGRRLSDGSTSADGYANIDLSLLPQGSYLLVVLFGNEKKVFRLFH